MGEVATIISANLYYNTSLLPNNAINVDTEPSNINSNLYTQIIIKFDKHFKLVLATMQTKLGTNILNKLQLTYLYLNTSSSKIQFTESNMINNKWNPTICSLAEFTNDCSTNALTLIIKPAPPSFSSFRTYWINLLQRHFPSLKT